MDAIYRYQRHIYDFTRRYYLLGRDQMIDALEVPASGRVLEIGCGTARNLIATARKFPDAQLYGIDISVEMLKTAKANIDRAGLDTRIRLKLADATDFDAAREFGIDGFERIFLSYTLSMIPGWKQVLNSAADNLSPAGELHCVDFSSQRNLPVWFARLLTLWLKQFHVTPRFDLARQLDDIARTRGGTSETNSIYRDYAVLGRLKSD